MKVANCANPIRDKLPSTCIVHRGAQGEPNVPCARWHTNDVVSLDVCVCVWHDYC